MNRAPNHSRLLIALVFIALFAWGGECRAGDGWTSPFDGKSLANWEGDASIWRVEEGAITGETKQRFDRNTFLIWRGGTLADFELKLQFKVIGGNSGIQYRSFELPDKKWVVGGYQADIDAADRYMGVLYGEHFRGMLAERGEHTRIGADHKPTLIQRVGDPNQILTKIKRNDWNDYEILARGYHFEQRINGVLTAIVDDEDQEQRRALGILALQVHSGPPMKVQFRNLRLRMLK